MADQLHYTTLALEYAEDVTEGRIPACKWINLACERFLDDLELAQDDDFPFRYAADRAERACRFIERCPHTKGRWAARREKIELEPWQCFMVCNIFGWVRKDTGFRRYQQVLLIVPRKNAKSTLAAAMGLYMLAADGEFGAEVYSGATTEKQAWEVFQPARLMADRSPAMKKKFGIAVNASNINIVTNGSKFETIIGDPGDGASPSCAIVDEYHEHKTDRMFDTMLTGMGAREQPLMLVITTAGDNIAGPCYAMQERVQQALERTRDDPQLFGLIYTIDPDDDWTSEETLRKANPNFDVSVSGDFLRARQIEAMTTPRKQAVFKTKHLNVWVQSREAYFDLLRWNKAAQPRARMEDYIEWECIVGVDLAEKKDLTAVEYLFRDQPGENARYAGFGRYYAPAGTINLPENEHLREWRDKGLLIETPGDVTDQRFIEEDIKAHFAKYSVREIVFDPWHSRQIAVQLAEDGMDCVEFRASPSNMNEPMRNMDALITDGRIIHDGNQLYSWMLGNVVNGGRKGTTDLHRPDKEKPENKIDGPVARIMALGRFLLDEGDDIITLPDDYSPGM